MRLGLNEVPACRIADFLKINSTTSYALSISKSDDIPTLQLLGWRSMVRPVIRTYTSAD